MEQSDHDLLVTIYTDMKWLKERVIDHEKEDASAHALNEGRIKKAHERIDETNGRFNWLVLSCILVIVLFVAGMLTKS